MQVTLLLGVACFVFAVLGNLNVNLSQLGTEFGFESFSQSAGFPIAETLPLPGWDYSPESSYWEALIAGFLNTLKVSAAALGLSLLVGFAAGILRLYGLAEVRFFLRYYVLLIRGLPVLLQLIIWYTLIVGFLPPLSEGGLRWLLLGTDADTGQNVYAMYLNNRGLFLAYPSPWAHTTGGWGWVTPVPTFGGRNLSGGLHLSPEFLALFLGLGVYTSAFIAETVRGGLQAVERGQREAAAALGLSSWQTLRLVILPQARKIIVPPLASQMLSLVKNSSLAVAVGYPDLVAVGGTILNQAGRSIEIVLVWMAVYLSLSLCISVLLNKPRSPRQASHQPPRAAP